MMDLGPANHMKWEGRPDSTLGDLYAEFWRKLSDKPVFTSITFNDACMITSREFPPRVMIKRHIARSS